MLIIGIVVFIGQPAFAQEDIEQDVMLRGDDYTRTWAFQGYSSWIGTSSWGGWYWGAQYISPCPQFMKVPDYYGACEWTVPAEYEANTDPQTDYGEYTELDGTIVDDLYARVVDHWLPDPPGTTEWKGILDQDLDILFGRYSGAGGHKYVFLEHGGEPHTTDTIIDQSMDQQFAFWEDENADGYVNVNTEDGITQRIVQEFGLELISTWADGDGMGIGGSNVFAGATVEDHLQEGFGFDQWVVQWLRDIMPMSTAMEGGKQGIDQLYSSWFADEGDFEPTCLKCTHTYDLGHDTVTKAVDKTTDHDHNPLGGETYTHSGSQDEQWDP